MYSCVVLIRATKNKLWNPVLVFHVSGWKMNIIKMETDETWDITIYERLGEHDVIMRYLYAALIFFFFFFKISHSLQTKNVATKVH